MFFILIGASFLAEANWKNGWYVAHDQWTRNNTMIRYRVTNLEPETRYIFRVIADNARGASVPSEPTVSLRTGNHFVRIS